MPQETGEIKIPVPYGCIAAKTWGKSDSNCHKILALHGWQDNCGSFDRLIPLLPDSVYVLAPDLPGHGLSSHLPDGCPYSDIAFVMEIKRIVNHLNWSSFSILGHSMGAMLAILYSSIYPQSVVKVISIDIVKPFTFSRDQMADTMRGFVNSFIRLDKKDSIPPVYGHQMVVEKMISAHSRHGKLDEESVQCLLNRGSQVSSDGKGEYFTRDNRIKTIFVQVMDCDNFLQYCNRIKCELIIIRAKNGAELDSQHNNDVFIEFYKRNCKKFKLFEANGEHHIHLIDPQTVANIINNEFLNCT